MNRLITAGLLFLASWTCALAQSTIIPTVPGQNSPLSSAPVRGNFLAAYNDINGILGMHPAATTGGCPVQPLVGTDCLVNTSSSVDTWYKYTGATAGYGSVAIINKTTGVIQAAVACSICAVTNATNTFTAYQIIDLNTATLQAAQTGTLLQVGNANGVVSRIEADAFAAAAHFSGVRFNGSVAGPTVIVSGNEIVSINAFGYDAVTAGVATGPWAAFRCYGEDTWSSTLHGTYCDIAVTAGTASATLAESIRFENDAGITVPSTVTGGDQGAGTINAGGLYVNGVAVATASIAAGAANDIPYYTAANTIGALAAAANSVLVTDGSGVPSISTTLPSGLVIPGYAQGPGSSTIGCAAPWANTSGTLLANNCNLKFVTGGLSTDYALQINNSGQADRVPGRNGPLLIWNDPSSNLAGQPLGQMIWIGSNLGSGNATPGANSFVAQTIYIDNLNSRSGIWATNFVAVQQPVSSGGSTGIVHGLEFDAYANIAVATALDPYTSGSAVHNAEFVASSNPGGTAVNPQVAGWCWSADGSASAATSWWNFCYSAARAQYAGFVGADYTGDSASTSFTKALLWDKSSSAYTIKVGPNLVNTSTAHSGVIDLSQDPGIGNFVLGLSGGTTALPIVNNADYPMTVQIGAGLSAAQNVSLEFMNGASGSNVVVWELVQDTGPNFNLENNSTGHTIFNVNVTTDLTTWERPINFTSTVSVGGNAMTFPGSAATLLYSGGALGTPSGGTVTNLTGTASININGTVGATTASSGVFTTLTAGGLLGTTSAGSASAPSVFVGNATTGLYSVSTTGFGVSVNGSLVVDFGITNSGSLTVAGSQGGIFTSNAGLFLGGVSTVSRSGSTGAVTINSNASNIILTPAGTTADTFGASTLSLTMGTGAQSNAVCAAGGTNGAVTTDSSGTICGLSPLWAKNLLGTISPTQALSGIVALRTDFWKYKPEYQDGGATVHVGLIADDVEKMDARCAVHDKSGKLINYSDRCVELYLVSAVQAINARLDVH